MTRRDRVLQRELPPSYNESDLYWRQYQKFFPEEIQLKAGDLPSEEWWEWDKGSIHIDRMLVTSSKLKIISVHGAGGNGRMLAPYAKMLQNSGYEVVSPDLPPYGLSRVHSSQSMDYQLWTRLISDLIDRELERDGRPVVLLGSSIGGMLAYHAAVHNKKVKGLIATTFIDTSRTEVRDQLAPNKLISRFGKSMMDAFPMVLDSLKISVNHVSRMHFISNNNELNQLIMNDSGAAGTKIPLRLLRTFLDMKLSVKPEHFEVCPVLLVHPQEDRMTPISLSEPFYNKLRVRKKCVILEGAGHFPLESPGMEQMKDAVLAFLQELENE
ncbi:alpha/beta hydrolase [Paenibacillus sp. NPDC057934]|uniref:alpha/beta hydrolase n=1 Tax=Paenibacillus sp. NPDC057934 TaxID=3346282 RepID=UPI0036DA8BF8